MRRMWDERHYSYPGRSVSPSLRDKGFRKESCRVGRSQQRPGRMANPSEGPNMKTKGEALRFVVMVAQKIHRNQLGPAEGEAFGRLGRCVK
jgi:hypothetical protein